MGYLDSMVDASFRDRDDDVLFLPWGMLGRAYVVESRRRYRELRRFCRRYLAVSLPTVAGVALGATLVARWQLARADRPLALAAIATGGVLAVLGVYYGIRVRSLVYGLRLSEEPRSPPRGPGTAARARISVPPGRRSSPSRSWRS